MRQFILAAIILASGTIAANAEVISVVETVTGTGALGGVDCTNQTVTFTATGDTANVSGPSGITKIYTLSSPTVTVQVGSGTPATFTSAYVTDTTLSNTLAIIAGGSSVLRIANTAFRTYYLESSIGPITGSATTTQSGRGLYTYATDAGQFGLGYCDRHGRIRHA